MPRQSTIVRTEAPTIHRSWGVEQGVQARLGDGTYLMHGGVFHGMRGMSLGGEGCTPRDPGDDG